MAFKDRLSRALHRASDSSYTSTASSSSNDTSPTSPTGSPPDTTTTTPHNGRSRTNTYSSTTDMKKTTSMLSLTKTFTVPSGWTKEGKREKLIREWERCDEDEWLAPVNSGWKGRGKCRLKDPAIQHRMRRYELQFGRASIDSLTELEGISPCTSRTKSATEHALEMMILNGEDLKHQSDEEHEGPCCQEAAVEHTGGQFYV